MDHTPFINNWDMVDTSAPHIVGAFLADKSRKPLYILAKSGNLWERRIAVLATFFFIRQGDFIDTLSISELLLRVSMPIQDKSNIVLIGMPGSGKSTVGIILAKLTSRDFVDTDLLIQIDQGRPLQDIVDQSGYMTLREIEEGILLGLNYRNYVIATGGSAAYSHDAMLHLKKNGMIIFLNVDLPTLESRIDNFSTRGLAKRPEQSLADLFKERYDLYTTYADVVVDCNRLNQEAVCRRVISETGVLNQ
ncbi:MAG: shikimate kinase [Desulfobacterales bacterium]|nr:shikimate kinase [Desulfobacterales bacterium]